MKIKETKILILLGLSSSLYRERQSTNLMSNVTKGNMIIINIKLIDIKSIK